MGTVQVYASIQTTANTSATNHVIALRLMVAITYKRMERLFVDSAVRIHMDALVLVEDATAIQTTAGMMTCNLPRTAQTSK